MAELVYILCTLTSLTCAILLLRYYYHTQVRFLLWSGVCFFGFALNNGLLFLDLVIYPELNISILRAIPAFIGLMIFIFALIWDTVGN